MYSGFKDWMMALSKLQKWNDNSALEPLRIEKERTKL